MIPKPKYIENILEITKSGKGFICCDVICECESRHFICYKNVLMMVDRYPVFQKIQCLSCYFLYSHIFS